jgi:hypothetical protein
MGLTEEMRAAVEAPPPSRIDLDELVHRGRARRVRSRATVALAGLAGFVAVALGSIGVYSVTASPHTTRSTLPVGGPPPGALHQTPSASASTTTIQQLTAALHTFPASLHVPADVTVHYGGTGSGAATQGYYYTAWNFGGVNYVINVYVHDVADPSQNACDPGGRGDPTLGCDRAIDQFGQTYTVSNQLYAHKDRITSVDNFRPGGTHVYLSVIGHGSVQIPSTQDIQTAAHVPGLTINS